MDGKKKICLIKSPHTDRSSSKTTKKKEKVKDGGGARDGNWKLQDGKAKDRSAAQHLYFRAKDRKNLNSQKKRG